MKQIYFLITIFLFLSSPSCKKSKTIQPTTPVTDTASYTLTVNGGVGSGTYKKGDTVYVFSNPPSATQVFNGWAGDTSGMSSPHEWRSILKMPAKSINLLSTYKSIFGITFTNIVINGNQVYYYVPPNYRGILLPFHGTGGSAANWATQQAENMNFCTYAAANGYALVITESKDRTNMQWDLSQNNNVDVLNIDTILTTLQTKGIISVEKPYYGVGMSDGSTFCSLIAYERNYKAEGLYCLGGIDAVFPLTTVPTLWNMAVNDVTMDPTRELQAQANYNLLLSRKIACQYYVNDATPLYPSRFSILPYVGVTGSTSIYNAFKSAGYVDAKGFFNIDPFVSTTWQSAIPAPYNPAADQPVGDQLNVCYAQHCFYKDSNYRTITFFNRF